MVGGREPVVGQLPPVLEPGRHGQALRGELRDDPALQGRGSPPRAARAGRTARACSRGSAAACAASSACSASASASSSTTTCSRTSGSRRALDRPACPATCGRSCARSSRATAAPRAGRTRPPRRPRPSPATPGPGRRGAPPPGPPAPTASRRCAPPTGSTRSARAPAARWRSSTPARARRARTSTRTAPASGWGSSPPAPAHRRAGEAVREGLVRAPGGHRARARDGARAVLGDVRPGLAGDRAVVPRSVPRCSTPARCPTPSRSPTASASGTSGDGPRPPRSRAGANLMDALLVRLGLTGVSAFASAGDFGSTCNGQPVPGVAWPASSPYLTAVGGSRLVLNAANQRVDEVVWNDLAWLSLGQRRRRGRRRRVGGVRAARLPARPERARAAALGARRGRPRVDAAGLAGGDRQQLDRGRRHERLGAAGRGRLRRAERARARRGPAAAGARERPALRPARGRSSTSSAATTATAAGCPPFRPSRATTRRAGSACRASTRSRRRCRRRRRRRHGDRPAPQVAW